MQNAQTSKQTTYSHINSATVGHDGTGLLAASFMLHCKCSFLKVPPASTQHRVCWPAEVLPRIESHIIEAHIIEIHIIDMHRIDMHRVHLTPIMHE